MSGYLKRLGILLILGVSVYWTNTLASSKQLLVVTNVKEIGELNKSQLRQVYLEGGIKIPVKPLGFKAGNKYRSIFNIKIIGLTEARIKSYWAQMKFTGRASPPKEFSNVEELLDYLANNSGYIAYIPSDTKLPDGLHVVHVVNY